jgi:5-formyltetrahydrofolate cyclo-ligase
MNPVPPKDAKSLLRDEIRAARKAMSRQDVETGSLRIQEHLVTWLGEKKFGAVAAYMAVQNEPVIHPVMERDERHDRRWYFPRVLPHGAMEFVAWRSYEPLRKGTFGIKEPSDGQRLEFEGRDIVILMPCVAVDRAGNRLGSGAGYYDRFIKTIPEISRVTLVGVCWERFFLADPMPAESFDVPVNAVVTEKRFITITEPLLFSGKT